MGMGMSNRNTLKLASFQGVTYNQNENNLIKPTVDLWIQFWGERETEIGKALKERFEGDICCTSGPQG